MTRYVHLVGRFLFGGICILLLINLLASYWDTKPLGHATHLQLLPNNHNLMVRLPPITTYTSISSEKVNSTSSRLSNFSAAQPSSVLAAVHSSNGSEIGNRTNLPICKLPEYDGYSPFELNTTIMAFDDVDAELMNYLDPGGSYEPKDCLPQHHVAIVVPFRDRYAHLSVFIRNIHPFLMKQRIAYRIFIIEQTNGDLFNRAALMNVGFLEAMKLQKWDCFIFHDVDLLPLDNRNFYTCPRQPRHMSVAVDEFSYRLPYNTIFGGVSAMTTEQFLRVNGFSNSFFGWGGEDDDMSNRLKNAKLYIARYPFNIARYIMLKHAKEKANPKRYLNLVNGIQKMKKDGLNSIRYDVYSTKNLPTYTWYLTELKFHDPST